MTTEHPDVGHLLDRRKFLKGAAALAALAAAAAGTPALAQNEDNDRELRGLAKRFRKLSKDLADELVKKVDEITPQELKNIKTGILFLLDALLTSSLAAARALGLNPRRRDLIKELHEATVRDLDRFFDEIRKPLIEVEPRPAPPVRPPGGGAGGVG
jgi:hypothetical protein